MSRGAILILVLITAGCAHRPTTYRLLRSTSGPVVVPPQVATPDLAARTFVADVPAGGGSCAPHAALRIRRQGKKLRITANRDVLQRQAPGWLAEWTVRAETDACVAQGYGMELAARILQALPLDSAAAFRLVHADTIQAGYVDLGPENRVEIRSPIAAEAESALEISKITGRNTQLDVDLKGPPSQTIGYETAWYGVARNSGRIGLHFTPLYADRTVQGAVEHLDAPSTNLLQFPPEALFFRLFYKGDDNGVQAIVVAGGTRDDLDRRTKSVASNTAACGNASAMCRVLPRRVGVNPFLVVTVNGRGVPVPVRSNLSAAIRATGAKPDDVLKTLNVTKLFGERLVPVEFDRQSREILNLQLFGGEAISWQ